MAVLPSVFPKSSAASRTCKYCIIRTLRDVTYTNLDLAVVFVFALSEGFIVIASNIPPVL